MIVKKVKSLYTISKKMNKNFPNIIEAKPLENYKLFLKFDDGINGEIELSNLKGKGVFEYWNDENNFKNFKIIDNIIIWNDILDMDSNAFYLKIINKTFEEYARD
jgi:hypothetical protein